MSARRGVFDASRLTALDDLMALPAPPSQEAPADKDERTKTDEVLPADSETARSARGAGGRPRTAPSASSAAKTDTGSAVLRPSPVTLAVAVRIPRALYASTVDSLFTGRTHPSWAQAVAWTCADDSETVGRVVAESVGQTSDRLPRGRRVAADSVQIVLRLRDDELALIDAVRDKVARDYGRVTRTAVAVAALQVRVGRSELDAGRADA